MTNSLNFLLTYSDSLSILPPLTFSLSFSDIQRKTGQHEKKSFGWKFQMFWNPSSQWQSYLLSWNHIHFYLNISFPSQMYSSHQTISPHYNPNNSFLYWFSHFPRSLVWVLLCFLSDFNGSHFLVPSWEMVSKS